MVARSGENVNLLQLEGCIPASGDRKVSRNAISWGMDKTTWEEKAREAFEAYLAKLRAELPKDANFAMMEQALLKHSPEMMSKTLEALVNAEDFSPESKRNT
jgi:hypothetical protein